MKRFLPLAAVFLSSPAFAHHAMGGEVPQTLFQGLLSGLAHPVIGIDHLAFIVLVGIAAAASGRVLAAPLAFIAATLAGTAIHLAGVGLPLAEHVLPPPLGHAGPHEGNLQLEVAGSLLQAPHLLLQADVICLGLEPHLCEAPLGGGAPAHAT